MTNRLNKSENDSETMNWFITKFNSYCTNDKMYINEDDFNDVVNDIEVGDTLSFSQFILINF